ncbi:MAG: hypothetical protein Q7T72_07710 [Bacteroidales bacterium]|nr:hypothetical protein [Bacteroidales bacterium]MDP3002732.1 hypothetical protein [Bacteroidales bacterium]
MSGNIFLFIFLFSIFTGSGLYGIEPIDSESVLIKKYEQDTLKENQILYNGKLWRNRYYKIREDQFLFSKEFLSGNLSINGQSFKNLNIRYDIYNDEIMIPTNHGAILQLNKEMVDSFTINFNNKAYKFIKIQEDSVRGFNGYVNVLYKGKNALYVKYKKEIEFLAVERKFDMFYQIHRIYFVKDNIVYQVTGKGDLLKVLNEDKVQIRNYIKKNKLKISKKRPESFIPVIDYYDSISQ